ncbi:MarR family transcriptional regulator [Nocardioides mangrovicus]|uniref:MarR family transcriptional regulator n=1 Tax=Nocardioides mangrovicus TaxID=2478913 RepID=A0A3L8P1M7_9ACTN|nr:MarR family transcriptional regulator [Nocardioides mangrovicus]RLV48328.1 MarR family transcriptional regulator [Nocardioides mangrovicus]
MTRAKQRSVDLLEQEIGVMVRRIKAVMAERARTVHPELSTPSYLMLSFLAENGPMRSTELADRFNIDKGAISRQVHHLCELGLIARTPDPEDGRAQQIEVNDKGRARLAETARSRRALLEQRLETWSAEELSDFVDALTRYNESLEPTVVSERG